MKYIVVGTSHSGYEVIQTLLKEDENRSEERRVGKSVDLGGRRIIKKKKKNQKTKKNKKKTKQTPNLITTHT